MPQRCGAVDAPALRGRETSRGVSGNNGGMREAPQDTPETTDRTSAMPPDESAPVEPAPTVPASGEPAAADEAGTRAEPAPQPKSAYELPSRKNTVLRNMVWALALTMAVVVVVGIAFFGVGSDGERERLENSEVDVAASAERAEGVAPFPVALPALGDEWIERSARFADGQNPQWVVQYSSPEGQLITLRQESELGAPMLSSSLPGSTVEDEFALGGAQCTALSGGEKGAQQQGIACEGEDWGFVVHGAAERGELEEVATAAVDSLG